MGFFEGYRKFYQGLTELLCEALKDALRLNKKNDLGITRRAELQQVEKQKGKPIEELECQEIPDYVQYLWNWFWEINETRSSNGFGMNPLTFLEIQAWSNLNMYWVRPWEVKTIKRMDAVLLEFQAEDSKKAGKK